MFQRIVVATDLSGAADCVIGSLGALRPLGVQAVVLVHALGLRHLPDMKELLAPKVEPQLQAQRAQVEAQGFAATYAIMPGLPGDEVNRAAQEQRAAMIVVGMRRVTFAHEWLVGGSALDILRQASVPVLAMRVQVLEDPGGKQYRVAWSEFGGPLLHPTDFSDTAERAFTCVERFVERGARGVTLLHVQDQARLATHSQERMEEFNRIDQARLERLKSGLERKGATDVRIEMPVGPPSQEIVRCAEKGEASLVVMGSRGRSLTSGMVLGSVSHQVVRQASVPVLLIPPVR